MARVILVLALLASMVLFAKEGKGFADGCTSG